ncbi:MAG TPA: hypothetical protein PLP17_02505, partial [Oligoflexia bacterium]|nr:hypothetical protein [Oligoflexia bacterium]
PDADEEEQGPLSNADSAPPGLVRAVNEYSVVAVTRCGPPPEPLVPIAPEEIVQAADRVAQMLGSLPDMPLSAEEISRRLLRRKHWLTPALEIPYLFEPDQQAHALRCLVEWIVFVAQSGVSQTPQEILRVSSQIADITMRRILGAFYGSAKPVVLDGLLTQLRFEESLRDSRTALNSIKGRYRMFIVLGTGLDNIRFA